MPFDAERFQAEQWKRREFDVKVPALADWFGKDEPAIWRIRNLEGHELSKAKFAKERNIRLKVSLESISEMLSVKDKKKLKDSITGIFGNVEGDSDAAWRTELLIFGSLEPEVDYPLAAKLFKVRPTEYYLITNEIIRLTGLGHEPGKQPPSGETKRSKQR